MKRLTGIKFRCFYKYYIKNNLRKIIIAAFFFLAGIIYFSTEKYIKAESEISIEKGTEVLNIPETETTDESETSAESEGGSSETENEKININTADAEQLTSLKGIGEVLAGRIIAYRAEHGDFKDIHDIVNVSGIGEKTYEKIKDNITV